MPLLPHLSLFSRRSYGERRGGYQVSSELFDAGIDHVNISSLMSPEKQEAIICEIYSPCL